MDCRCRNCNSSCSIHGYCSFPNEAETISHKTENHSSPTPHRRKILHKMWGKHANRRNILHKMRAKAILKQRYPVTTISRFPSENTQCFWMAYSIKFKSVRCLFAEPVFRYGVCVDWCISTYSCLGLFVSTFWAVDWIKQHACPIFETVLCSGLFCSGKPGGTTVCVICFFFFKDDSATNASVATITTIITIRIQK